mmetsp:Transcript_14739/g.43950  ORF Transcript_14739/g.43950 Transcript_14739/m.43950 type:complete len:95 (+) Transcript_14739:135-419(+)
MLVDQMRRDALSDLLAPSIGPRRLSFSVDGASATTPTLDCWIESREARAERRSPIKVGSRLAEKFADRFPRRQCRNAGRNGSVEPRHPRDSVAL